MRPLDGLLLGIDRAGLRPKSGEQGWLVVNPELVELQIARRVGDGIEVRHIELRPQARMRPGTSRN